MADPTIVQLVKTYFTSDFYKKASETLDERKYEMEKALSAIIPLILGAMLHKATENKESCESIFNDCRDAERVFSVNYDYELLFPQTENKDLLFDDKHREVIKEIANYSGIKTSSVSGLISLAVPSILGLLGKHIMRNKFSASGLAGYLSSQEKFIALAIPSRLASMESYFQISPVPKANNKLHWDYSFKKFTTVKWKRWRRAIVLVSILIVLAAVYFLFLR